MSHNSSVLREDSLNNTNITKVRRSPTTTQGIAKNQSLSYPIAVHEWNYGSQFTSLPIKEISYISATSNARSLPAWMDEFCPGVK